VALNKQQINREEVEKSTEKLGYRKKLSTPKRMRIRPKYSPTVVFSRQEDKDGTKQTIS